jgi:hypothetical protein
MPVGARSDLVCAGFGVRLVISGARVNLNDRSGLSPEIQILHSMVRLMTVSFTKILVLLRMALLVISVVARYP